MVFGSFKKLILEKKQKPKEPALISRLFEENKILQILAKSQRNNCIIIGHKGVGKTSILESLKKKAPKATVFIDDVHLLSNEKALSLKEQIIDKSIQCVVTTSFSAYKNYQDFDGFFANNFTPILLSEPSNEDMISILTLKAKEFGDYHNVFINTNIFPRLVELSQRYFYKLYLPSSAIDVLDEVCVKKTMLNVKTPAEIENLITNITNLKSKDLNPAEKIELHAFEAKYNKLSQDWLEKKQQKTAVGIADVCELVAEKTGLDVGVIKESFREKINNLEFRLNNKVVGQEEAIKNICNAIKERFINQASSLKPLSFCFLGPVGVGKYKVCKEIAKCLFDDINNLVSFVGTSYQVIITDDLRLASQKNLKNNILVYKENNDFIDAVINFKQIEKKDARLIAKAQVLEIANQLKERNISLEVEEQVYMFLINKGFDSTSGVENMRKIVNNELYTKVSKAVLEHNLSNCTICAYFEASGIEIKIK